MDRVLSGVQPTGALHLGNYLGAIRQWVGLQDQYECLFCIVDLHALTTLPEAAELRRDVYTTAATFLACGIRPENIFVQSAVPQHTQLAWVLNCVARTGWLDRMTQFKDKSNQNAIKRVMQARIGAGDRPPAVMVEKVFEVLDEMHDAIGVGLYTYPVLMAADILLYKATRVPVGDDQRQHLQLARQIARSFNDKYGDIFPEPQDMIVPTVARVMGLRTPENKMSKSSPSDQDRINLTDSADEIVQKVKRATTDTAMLPADREDLEGRPGAANLLRIFAALTGGTLDDACREFAGKGFGDLKPAVTEVLINRIVPIGREITRLLDDTEALYGVMRAGNERAERLARNTIIEVNRAVGIG